MIAYPPEFAWPEQLTAEQIAWLVAWAETFGDVFIADAKIIRDTDADGGLTLAIVVDLEAWPGESVEHKAAVAFRPFDVMHTMEAPSITFPVRRVVAVELPRFESLVRQAQPKQPALSLVPMEGA